MHSISCYAKNSLTSGVSFKKQNTKQKVCFFLFSFISMISINSNISKIPSLVFIEVSVKLDMFVLPGCGLNTTTIQGCNQVSDVMDVLPVKQTNAGEMFICHIHHPALLLFPHYLSICTFNPPPHTL